VRAARKAHPGPFHLGIYSLFLAVLTYYTKIFEKVHTGIEKKLAVTEIFQKFKII